MTVIVDAVVEEDGSIVFRTIQESDQELKSRSIIKVSKQIELLSTSLGGIVASISQGLSTAKDNTKEIEVDIGFEITGGFDLRVVEGGGKGHLNLKLKL